MKIGMVRGGFGYAVAAACSSLIAMTAPLKAETRAVIELFTSQGCSSCPAADKLLGELANDPAFVPISLNIDYWDYLGWKDTLANSHHSLRQKAYSKARGDRKVYTPQVVVNGNSQALGSDRNAIERAIVQSRRDSATLSLPLTVKVTDGKISVSAPEGRSGRGEVWLYGLARQIPVEIKRGENRGRTIVYHNVARCWLKLGEWTGKAETWSVPLSEIQGDNIEQGVIILQSGSAERPGTILGAAAAAVH